MLGDVSAGELAEIVAESMGRPAVPALFDEAVRRRAMRVAVRQGLRARIEAELEDREPIRVLRYSDWREFRRSGDRTGWRRLQDGRRRQVELAGMAVYLGMHEKAAYLQDLLWAECETEWWGRPAHEAPGCPIDLFAAGRGAKYALISTMLGRAIGTVALEVVDRVRAEIRRRILDEYLNPRNFHWWRDAANNWNANSNGAIGLAAMLLEGDAERLALILRNVLAGLRSFLSGYTDDGGCTEGPGYALSALGPYATFAAALHDFTGGRIDIMRDPKVERICRFPLAVWVAGGQRLTFADTAETGHLSVSMAAAANRFWEIPDLYGLCSPAEGGGILVDSLTDLLTYDGRDYAPPADRRDYHLGDLGVAKVRAGPTTVGAKAGDNGESHNHNDVGSFLVHRGGTFFLTDPGGPQYTASSFGPKRYESVFCNSFGHSVPAINGRGQPDGGVFAGTMSTEGFNSGGVRRIVIELAGAYDAASLKRLTRVIEVPPDGGEVRLTDSYAFTEPPQSVQEAFITTLPAEVAPGGASVTIRSEADGSAELVAVDTPGRFEVTELTADSAESRSGQLLRRITFTPRRLGETMTVAVAVRLPR